MITVIRNGKAVDLTATEISELESINATATEGADRAAKIEEIKQLVSDRVNARIDGLGDIDTLLLVVGLIQSGICNAPTQGTDGWACREIYLYGRDKIAQARTAPIALVRGYDPAADPLFPA